MKIIKKLGIGIFGTVYLVEDNKQKYAMKIQKILDIDMTKNSLSPIYRELEFNENIGEIYPQQFVKLYNYEFEENCKHVQKYPPEVDEIEKNILEQNGIVKQKFIQLQKSTNCVKFFYELMDGTLEQIFHNLSRKQFVSMLIQIIYIISILEKNDYKHNNFQFKNILYKKVPNNTQIKINRTSVSTYGYIYKLAGYGLLTNTKYKMTTIEKKNYKNSSDLLMFMYMLPKQFPQIWKNKDIDMDYIRKSIKKEGDYEFIKKSNIFTRKNEKDYFIETMFFFL